MTKWLLKKLYASIEINSGEITSVFKKIPKGFVIDLEDIIEEKKIENGLLYIRMKNRIPHINFRGNFSNGARQRILNCWAVHRDKYK